jgi:dTDP-4-dehydrorhamnose reductase
MIWLIGNKGMLGTDVENLLKNESIPYIASDKETDINDFLALQKFLAGKNISWIINCSAYTAVDRAEDEQEIALKINSHGVLNIAEIAKDKNAKLIHISTDYVFNGEKDGAYIETDITDPVNAYGKSKLCGEQKITDIIKNYFIIRISWLFGKNGNNFIYTMLRLFKERDEISVVADQSGSPTYTVDAAGLIIKIITENSDRYGIYHYTNEGLTSWHEFSTQIYSQAKELGLITKNVKIIPITTEQYPTKAKRPKNSYMSKDKIKNTFMIQIPEWQDALKRFLNEINTAR